MLYIFVVVFWWFIWLLVVYVCLFACLLFVGIGAGFRLLLFVLSARCLAGLSLDG